MLAVSSSVTSFGATSGASREAASSREAARALGGSLAARLAGFVRKAPLSRFGTGALYKSKDVEVAPIAMGYTMRVFSIESQGAPLTARPGLWLVRLVDASDVLLSAASRDCDHDAIGAHAAAFCAARHVRMYSVRLFPRGPRRFAYALTSSLARSGFFARHALVRW